MNFLHQEFDAGPDDVIEVMLDHAANVLLLDGSNYENYRNGRPFHYYGGYAKTSPARISPPRTGHWHLVIDLGGFAGSVRASSRVLSQAT
jgi:hypothetical protein